MITLNRVAGLAAGAAVVMGIAGLSNVPLPQSGATDGLLRLTWRARPERIEECREQTAQALENLPRHMRLPVICEGANASYQLEVRRNGVVVLETPVHPGGWRRDRPLYVFQELRVPTGDATVAVRFTRMGPMPSGLSEGRDDGPEARRHAAATRRREELTEAVPAALAYDETLHFAPGQVHVISYNPERQRLFEVMP